MQRISQDIQSAIKSHNGENDPKENPRLARALETARSASMPKERIESALRNGIRRSATSDSQIAVFEGVFPGGISIVVRASQERHKAVTAEIRALFSRADGEFGKALWLFDDRMTVVIAQQDDVNAAKIMELGIEEGAIDVERLEDGTIELLCGSLKEREQLRHKIATTFPGVHKGNLYSARELRPKSVIPVAEDNVAKMERLLNALDDHPDVFKVVHNAEM